MTSPSPPEKQHIRRSDAPLPLLIGAHFSIAKGLHEAVYTAHAYGCNALQIFTKEDWGLRNVGTLKCLYQDKKNG